MYKQPDLDPAPNEEDDEAWLEQAEAEWEAESEWEAETS